MAVGRKWDSMSSTVDGVRLVRLKIGRSFLYTVIVPVGGSDMTVSVDSGCSQVHCLICSPPYFRWFFVLSGILGFQV